MENEKLIISEELDSMEGSPSSLDERELINESLFNKFRVLGKDNFRWEFSRSVDYYKLVKDSAKFYNFNLPENFNKIFISYRTAYLFWIYKSPLLDYLENFFRGSMLKGARFDRYKNLKEFFIKWAVIQSKEDRKFYATSAISFIEKDLSKRNFINQIYEAVILTYEDSLKDYDRALSLYEAAQKSLETVNLEQNHKSELVYLIRLFKGFLKLSESQPLSAASDFNDALSIFPEAVAPKFHLALCECLSGNTSEAKDRMMEVLEFDLNRLKYSIDTNKFPIFNYFLEHNITRNIFNYPEMSDLFNVVEGIIDENRSRGTVGINSLRNRLLSFKECKINNFYTSEIVNNLTFLDKIAYNFTAITDTLFAAIIPAIDEKFGKTINLVGDSIKGYYYNEVEIALKVFANGIEEHSRKIEALKNDIKEYKAKIEKQLDSTIETYQKNVAQNIDFLEHRVENIEQVAGLNPKVSLKNNLNYSLILALMVFLIGGFASYAGNSISDISEFKGMISMVLATGLKWGSISFFIGVIISFFIAGSVALERTTQRQRIVHRISQLKNEKTRVIEQLKDEAKERQQTQSTNLEKRMAIHQSRIEELTNEENERKKELLEAAKEKIRNEFIVLNTLIRVPMNV